MPTFSCLLSWARISSNVWRDGRLRCDLVENSMMPLDSIDLCAMSPVAATFIHGCSRFASSLECQQGVSFCFAAGELRAAPSISFVLSKSAGMARNDAAILHLMYPIAGVCDRGIVRDQEQGHLVLVHNAVQKLKRAV